MPPQSRQWRAFAASRPTRPASGDRPDRRRGTVEEPIARLHDFRNRLAHHERIWNHSPRDRYDDLLTVAGYIDPELRLWISSTETGREVLDGACIAGPIGGAVNNRVPPRSGRQR
jgi:hypothetical protein